MKCLAKLALLGVAAGMSCPLAASGYPAVEMQACMVNAMNAVTTKNLRANYQQVEAYCDCSLTAIIDRGQDINQSLARCNAKAGF